MVQKINIPRYILMLVGYLSFLFGSGGLTFQIFSQPNSTGGISFDYTLLSGFLMIFGLILVFISTKLNKYKMKEKTNVS